MPRANWLYFLGTKKNKQELFVYGLSMETKYQKLYSDVNNLGNVGNKKLYLFESVSSEIDLSELNKKQINLKLFHNKVDYELEIKHSNKFIQNYNSEKLKDIPASPIGQTVYMNVLYTTLFHEYQDECYLKEENKTQLMNILTILEEDNGQNFKSAYHQRLGCFEYAETMPWAETYAPFSISNATTIPNIYKITRKEEYKNEEHIVHLIVTTIEKNILLDEIKTFEKGRTDLIFNTPIINDAGYEYSVFSKQGKLIHKDKGYWALGISLQMNLVKDAVNLKTIEKGKEKSVTVNTYSPMNAIEIKHPDDKNIQNIKSNIGIIKALCDSKPRCSSQQWFDKNENYVEEIMKYLNSFLTGTNNSITIIDPFFSASAMYTLSQFDNISTKIEIVSCWENKDPDTGKKSTKEQEIQKVKGIIEKLKSTSLPIRKLSWYNLGTANFHDRYIWINKDDKDMVFSVSNSMNNLLKKYHFTMVELTGITKENTLKYLNEILEKCNSKNKILPEEDNV